MSLPREIKQSIKRNASAEENKNRDKTAIKRNASAKDKKARA